MVRYFKVIGVIDMNDDLIMNIQNRLFSRLGKKSGNFLLLKHYNTLVLNNEKKVQIEEKNPDALVYLHDFKLSHMVGVFEPFLDFIRNELGQLSDSEIDRLLDECQVYSLHRSIFKSFLKTGICVREETILIDEVDYEQEKIANAVINIVSYLARDRQLIFLLNDVQYASGSSLHVLINYMKSSNCQNVAIAAAYNEAKVSLPHVETIWNWFYETVCELELILETNYCLQNSQQSGVIDFIFSDDELDDYIVTINNLLFCLDFSQATYYLELIYKMITVEEIDISLKYKCEIINLYTEVSIYTQDFSQALLLCEKIREIKKKTQGLTFDYEYYYYMCLIHMYNGKLEEADVYARQCLEISEKQQVEYNIFISKLLHVMVKMSGWHNIFFCASDIPINDEVLSLAEKYHFWNHLAHIYVYAYDNLAELFADETKVDYRLTHFNRGIEIMKRLGNEYFMLEAYRNKIMIASTNGFFRTANYYYDKSHDLVRGKDIFEEAMIYNGVGYNSSAMGECEKAFSSYNQALEIFLTMEKIDYVGETLYNMALNCIMAQDYADAYDYLDLSFRIVKEMKMNSLRVCNISKLSGLLALCSHYTGNRLKLSIYTEKTRLFLEHLLDGNESDSENVIVHDYAVCKDDLYIYYYICALQSICDEQYDEAMKEFELAARWVNETKGNQFYIFQQFATEFARLSRRLGREDRARQMLREAAGFYIQQDCKKKVAELQAELENKPYKITQYKLKLPQTTKQKILSVLRHASISKENEEQQRRMNFMSAWQKMTEIGGKTKYELVNPAVNALMHNFNLDRLMLVKYDDKKPEALFNNTGYEFDSEMQSGIEGFFHRNRLGFVTSKINNNYSDYLDVVSLFDKIRVCSIIGIPFYYNDSLKAVMVAYITMKDNWHSHSNRYLLDEGDYAVFEFLVRQLISSVDMLEANKKIKQMNDKLNHLAVTDKLTGLYNREGFYGNIAAMISNNDYGKRAQPFTIMYIDLDNFKHYNDTFGHGVGDIILIEMANIFKEEVNHIGFAARFGGDEFLITLYTDNREQINDIAKDIFRKIEDAEGFTDVIRDKLGRAVYIPREQQISCSIGICSVPKLTSEEDLEILVKNADKTLYDVKKSGKGTYRFYASIM